MFMDRASDTLHLYLSKTQCTPFRILVDLKIHCSFPSGELFPGTLSITGLGGDGSASSTVPGPHPAMLSCSVTPAQFQSLFVHLCSECAFVDELSNFLAMGLFFLTQEGILIYRYL